MKISLKKVGILTFFGMALSVAIGFLLIEFVIEEKTGFFYRGCQSMGVFMGIMVFVIAGFCSALASISKAKPQAEPLPSKAFAIGNFVVAAAVIYESLFTHIGGAIPSWQTLLQVAFGLFSAALFILYGLAEFGISEVTPTFDIVFILFWLVRVMIVFSNYIPTSTLCENVFEMAALCSSLVFFLVSGKMRNGVNADKKNFVLPVAVFTVIICSAYAVPQVVTRLISGNIASGGATYLSNLACAFYVVTFIIRYFAKRTLPADKPEEIPEAEQIEKEETEEAEEIQGTDKNYGEFIKNYSPINLQEEETQE